MERKAWLRGVWEMVKEAFCQKLLTYNLPSSPFLLPDQFSGHTIIVTGATSGIGFYTARELAMCGAHVIMACRNTKAANEIARQWQEEAHDSRALRVEVMELDLLSLASVRSFAAAWEARAQLLHVLINNAGVFLMGEPQKFSDDRIEQHMQVNHVAPALVTLLLLPSLLRTSSSRIINVNSVAHHCAVVDPRKWNRQIDEKKFSSIRTYGASKLAHLMFLKTLASKLSDQTKGSIQCIAVHPGIVTTNLHSYDPLGDKAGRKPYLHLILKWASIIKYWKLGSPESQIKVRNVPSFQRKSCWRFDTHEGARSVLFCVASADVAANLVKGFAYYSCNCKPARVAAQAADVDACLGVWQKTLELLDLNDYYLTQLIANTSNPAPIHKGLVSANANTHNKEFVGPITALC